MSEYFSSLNHEERKDAVEKYKRWTSHSYTEMFTEWLESQHLDLQKADEEKSDFVSRFQFSYITIRNKAQRKLLRTILDKMNYNVQ